MSLLHSTTGRVLAFLLVVAAFLTGRAQAQNLDIFMYVVGSQQGVILGDAKDDLHKDWIDLQSFTDSLYVPLDSKGIPSTSQRTQRPFQVVKSADISSPQLYRALRTKERLSQVVIQVCNPGGSKDIRQEYHLVNATVVSMSTTVPNLELYDPVEMVGLTFQCITRKRTKFTMTGAPAGTNTDTDCLY